jgi:hypothetical protein
MPTCPVCKSSFAATARPKLYCSADCQSKAANARTNARRRPTEAVKTPRPALTLIRSEDPSVGQPLPRPECVLKPLEVEWLDCGSVGFDDLHRLVAGKMNKSASTRREDAVGNDRPPLGYAVKLAGDWVGRQRDRRTGAVIWQSPRFGSVEEAKRAVEARLLPVEVEAAANMNHPEPLALAA